MNVCGMYCCRMVLFSAQSIALFLCRIWCSINLAIRVLTMSFVSPFFYLWRFLYIAFYRLIMAAVTAEDDTAVTTTVGGTWK